jgi:hypothetical protein
MTFLKSFTQNRQTQSDAPDAVRRNQTRQTQSDAPDAPDAPDAL